MQNQPLKKLKGAAYEVVKFLFGPQPAHRDVLIRKQQHDIGALKQEIHNIHYRHVLETHRLQEQLDSLREMLLKRAVGREHQEYDSENV